jgi:hypothetical protein
MKNFFISYNEHDRQHAEWIGWQLEEAGYSIIMQAWDFKPGGNFVAAMHEAVLGTERALLLLSPNSLRSKFVLLEWTAIIAKDPDGSAGRLCPVRIAECTPDGLLAAFAYIDLVGARDGEEACARLLAGLRPGKPLHEPASPDFGKRLLAGPAPKFPMVEAVAKSVHALAKQALRFVAVTLSAALLVLLFLTSVAGETPPGYAPVLAGALVALLVEGGLSIAKRRRRAAASAALAAVASGEPA